MSRKRAWLALQIAFFAVAVWYFGQQLAGQWSQLAALPASLRPNCWLVAQSGAWVFAGYAILIESWRRTVIAWGGHLGWGAAARIWFISNLARFVPGKIWQLSAMGVLAQAAGVSSVAAVGASLVVNLASLLAAGLVVGLAGASRLAGPGFVAGVAVALALVAATPWVLPRVARLAGRMTGRQVPEPRMAPLVILYAVSGCMLAWGLYGVAFRTLAIALFGEPAGTTASYTAVFTLSYLSGYLVLFAPGGIGVRESVLTKLLPLAGLETGASALMLVVVSRLWLTVLEAAPGLIFLALARAQRSESTKAPHGRQEGTKEERNSAPRA